jgi:hypothetical protein
MAEATVRAANADLQQARFIIFKKVLSNPSQGTTQERRMPAQKARSFNFHQYRFHRGKYCQIADARRGAIVS